MQLMATESLQKADLTLSQILSTLVAGEPLPSAAQHQLEKMLLADERRAKVWEVTTDNVDMVVEQRSRLFQLIYPFINQYCRQTFDWPNCPPVLLWDLWLPLAMQLAYHHALGSTQIVGLLGVQGTGKTTMTAILSQILNYLGLQVCRLSLDDIYKTYGDRQQLRQFDPRFRWRGPPGTHDIELGRDVLYQLRHACCDHPILVPRFDKSAMNGAGDRTEPEWITCADIVLFEGWFVGVRPIDPTVFEQAPPPVSTEEDRTFARDINAKLQDYLPLWDQLDHLIVLKPTDYHLSQQWRRQAEHQMIATGRSGMKDEEVDQFVEYFWRSLHPDLFLPPLLQDPDYVDLVIEIDENHTPSSVYCPHGCSSAKQTQEQGQEQVQAQEQA
jgi:D-glycerate 3-kinase